MPKSEKYLIGPSLLSDIRQTITRVAGMSDGTDGVSLPVRLQELPRRVVRFYRGTFTAGTWATGSTMAVTVEGSTDTISVTNYCTPVVGLSGHTQTLTAVFGSIMGTMTAVEVGQPTCTMSVGGLDVTQLPGYVAGEIQMLGHGAADTNSTACFGLQWFSITQCSTAT